MYANNSSGDAKENITIVDLRSDTISVPTDAMRQAMLTAEVGDDVYGEDPTVKILEKKSAELLGMEAALFTPSGTMANLIAILVHCKRRGSELICGDLAHTFLYEQGGAAYLAGVQICTIPNKPDGTFCLKQMRRKVRSTDYHEPITSLVIVENTHNMCGGKVLPLPWLDELVQITKELDIKLHADGARLFNASEYLGIPPSRLVQGFSSACFCLSKGLSAPAGSVLVGDAEFIKEARRMRKALGGGMRQIGILAAAGLVALDQVVPTLKIDHANARLVAEAIYNHNSNNFVRVDVDNLHTNILLLEICDKNGEEHDKFTASDLAQRLAFVTEDEITNKITDGQGKGIKVRVSARDWKFARLVFYHQIRERDVQLAIKKILYVLSEFNEKYG
ncbi:probable low-specificity L-threonine aldolase 2 [Ctenocephalides felis]|uniref:probable low-specificity L-threonine aldolase 2 n=1 Tax=Ctenocephalides felis TaxID=7515 RepID=UPI000E6E11FB|nr:probable low-specificity L-threonine aldolase 2 [Ctenocephalides felis]